MGSAPDDTESLPFSPAQASGLCHPTVGEACTTMMKLRAFPTKIFWRASAPLPATQEWGEHRGEGAPNIRVPPLPSPLLHQMEEREWLRLCRAGKDEG
jgi:hypothetical protein